MTSRAARLLIETITSPDPAVRDRSVRDLIAGRLDRRGPRGPATSWRRSASGAENLYERVRASMFLHAIYRYRRPGSRRRSRRPG